MKKLLLILAWLFMFSTAFAQVCPVSYSRVKKVNNTMAQMTIFQFEPCDSYAVQLATMTAIALWYQQFPWAIFLTGNSLNNIEARWKSHWATKHYYSMQ